MCIWYKYIDDDMMRISTAEVYEYMVIGSLNIILLPKKSVPIQNI